MEKNNNDEHKIVKKFPDIRKEITKFIEDEDGSIPTGKLFTIGAFCIVLSSLFFSENVAYAAHSSHKSHSSHSSTSYHRSHGSHSNSHSSHVSSHASHASHASHSNTASHSNYNYGISGSGTTQKAPEIASIQPPQSPESFGVSLDIPAIGTNSIIGKSIIHEQSPTNENININSPQEFPKMPKIITNEKLKNKL